MNKIFVVGLARSGTSWIASIFDSHPSTILRFEPDITCRDEQLPFVFRADELDAHVQRAGEFGLRLHDVLNLRANGRPPFFEKLYRSPLKRNVRIGYWYAAKAAGVLMGDKRARQIRLPDFKDERQSIISVVKSVDSPGRLAPMAMALPECKFVFVIRHPCGVVNSQLQGVKSNKMPPNKAYDDWLKLEGAISRNLDAETLASFSPIEVNTWSWLLHNESVLLRTQNLDNVYVLNYDAMCHDLIASVTDLFSWCGLDVGPQVTDYLNRTLNESDSKKEYFSVIQQPAVAASKWKQELSEDEKQYVEERVRDSLPGELFFTRSG